MRIGVPTEIKADEYRVAITPAGVREMVEHGHEVLIQAGAGEGSAISEGCSSLTWMIISASANTVTASGTIVAPCSA